MKTRKAAAFPRSTSIAQKRDRPRHVLWLASSNIDNRNVFKFQDARTKGKSDEEIQKGDCPEEMESAGDVFAEFDRRHVR